MKNKTTLKVNDKDVSSATLIWLSDLCFSTEIKDTKIVIDKLKIRKFK